MTLDYYFYVENSWDIFDYIYISFKLSNLPIFDILIIPKIVIEALLPLLNSSYILKTLSNASIIFAIKFFIFSSLLMFVRGGIPRYRYDFLTKVGWIKLLTIIVILFLSTLLLTYLL